jgi:hypothetical protein
MQEEFGKIYGRDKECISLVRAALPRAPSSLPRLLCAQANIRGKGARSELKDVLRHPVGYVLFKVRHACASMPRTYSAWHGRRSSVR